MEKLKSENKYAGIILAAGRGSRMKELTANKPKCLLELAGRPLLQWQLDAMRKAGIHRILVVRGYAANCLDGPFETAENERWEKTSMLSTLLCSQKFVSGFFAAGGCRLLVSYSDIVWKWRHALKLLQAKAPIAITYDLLWEELWRLRFDEPLSDAETFVEENGWLTQIGHKSDDMSLIQGQYMGLLSFDKEGWDILLESVNKLAEKVDKTDMTAWLDFLLSLKIPVAALPVSGGWCECDNAGDIKNYESALASGKWAHDWRDEYK